MYVVKKRKRVHKILLYFGLACFLFWALAPVYWVLVTSLKGGNEIYAYPPTLIPHEFTLDNYREVLFNSAFPTVVKNSFIIAATVTLISLGIASPAAFAIARLVFPGRKFVARSIVITYLLPPTFLFIPLFVVLQTIGLIDTRFGLVLAYLTFTVPFCTWMLLGYFKSIPMELDEAARVDGASKLRTLLSVVLPIAAPAMSVMALFAFTHAWNEFLYSLVYVHSTDSKTFTSGLVGMMMGDTFIWGQLMAGSIIAILPIFTIYVFAQKYLIEGLAAGGVKA
jgi:ABC-type glycerol-3-phosphate transport system permease component